MTSTVTADDSGEGLSRITVQQAISRGDRVRDVIQAAILDGSLPQGTALVERELSSMLGVSKTPIREALKQLQSSGLVVASAYQGMRVRVLDAATVREVVTARAVVEPDAVRLAVVSRGPGPHEEARRTLVESDRLLDSGEHAQLSLKNREFHRALYVESKNDLLIDFLDKLQGLNTFIATAGWRAEATYDSERQEHAELLEAVEAGDAEASRRLLLEHISRSSDAVLRHLDDGAR